MCYVRAVKVKTRGNGGRPPHFHEVSAQKIQCPSSPRLG
jgi:hypothetical protein